MVVRERECRSLQVCRNIAVVYKCPFCPRQSANGSFPAVIYTKVLEYVTHKHFSFERHVTRDVMTRTRAGAASWFCVVQSH